MIILVYIFLKLKNSKYYLSIFLLVSLFFFMPPCIYADVTAGDGGNKVVEYLSHDEREGEGIPFKETDDISGISLGNLLGVFVLVILISFIVIYFLKLFIKPISSAENGKQHEISVERVTRATQKLSVLVIRINNIEYHVFQSGNSVSVYPSGSSSVADRES